MRVVPHGDGSEFMFTLIRQPGTRDEQFAADKAAGESDLRALKDLLEREHRYRSPTTRSSRRRRFAAVPSGQALASALGG
jgi:hypothetical protein